MNNIKKWCENKPVFIAIVATQAVVSSSAIYSILKIWKSGEKLTPNETPPDKKLWISLYKKNRTVINTLENFFAAKYEFAEISIIFIKIFNLFRKKMRRTGSKTLNEMLKNEIDKLILEEKKENSNCCKDFLQISYKDIEEDFPSKNNEEIQPKIEGEIKDPEIIFFYRVVVPCWFFHQKPPGILLRKARSGNIDALDKLLRIDSSLIHEPRIADIFHKSRWRKNNRTYSVITSALSKAPIKTITPKSVKCYVAGLVSAASQLFNAKLTEPEIRQLFDAVQMDSGGPEIDPDLPESPEAFAKAIQRERKIWLNSFQSDKK